MADLTIALTRTLAYEGGYSKNPNDSGGETYRGIARHSHPEWEGWPIVDAARKQSNFPNALEANPLVLSLVAEFYKANFWDIIQGESIPSQVVANELFDCAVNMGTSTAVRLLQSALNALAESDQPALSEDGVIGPTTLAALESRLFSARPRAERALLAVMLTLRARRYLQIVRRNPSQREFLYGWVSRLFDNPEFATREQSRSELA